MRSRCLVVIIRQHQAEDRFAELSRPGGILCVLHGVGQHLLAVRNCLAEALPPRPLRL
jgi:hypothetical protein